MRKLLLALLLMFTLPQTALAGDDINSLFPLSGFYADARYRYEHVEQGNLTHNANASTLRINTGYKTGTAYNFQGQIEFQAVAPAGADDYNSTVNGKTTLPVIADPTGVELNQMWLSYAGLPDTTVKAGRQGINIDNQRFVGTVAWRQNDQTFDSVVLTNDSIPNLNLLYSYISNVNRVFGDDNPLGNLHTRTHIAHAAYKVADWLTITGYGYWLDIKKLPALSSKTYGLRLTGKTPVNDDWLFFYEAEAARQHDYADNPDHYSASYYHLSPGATWKNLTLQAGFESLSGNGTDAFSTPFATLHAFNGWADMFLNTPVNGLEDLYGKVVYKFEDVHPWVDKTTFTGVYHNFGAENGSADYGDEWDFQLSRPLKLDNIGWSEGSSISLKYADYNANGFGADTQKWWVVFAVKF